MTRLALALCLFLCVACVPQAQAEPWLHGRTEPPTAGVVVTISWGGAPRSSTTNAGGAWGITPGSGMHTLTVTAPEGYTVTRIKHPVLGAVNGAVLQASITASTDLGADVVVYLASVQTPTQTATLRTPTPTITQTLYPTVTPTPTEFPTLPMPPVTPPIPTPPQGTAVPLPTPPVGGWEPWTPPAEIINAMVLDWEWWLEQFDSEDPLQFAVNDTYGAAWPIGGPMLTPWMYAGFAVRWQCFVTPKGVVFAFAMATEPYRVALVEW